MSIFDIDWNSDGDINYVDTAIDCMIINEFEQEDLAFELNEED